MQFQANSERNFPDFKFEFVDISHFAGSSWGQRRNFTINTTQKKTVIAEFGCDFVGLSATIARFRVLCSGKPFFKHCQWA